MSAQQQLSAVSVGAAATKRKNAPKNDEDDSGDESGSDAVSQQTWCADVQHADGVEHD